jgi:hypothetical protein
VLRAFGQQLGVALVEPRDRVGEMVVREDLDASLPAVWIDLRQDVGLGAERAEGRDVVSAWYVAATQSLGPVAADAMLSRAVRQFEDGTPGGDHSPRLFL